MRVHRGTVQAQPGQSLVGSISAITSRVVLAEYPLFGRVGRIGLVAERADRGYFLDGHTASARPGWVEVTGGTLSLAAAHQHKGCGSHLACGLPVTVARLWLKRGLPSSK